MIDVVGEAVASREFLTGILSGGVALVVGLVIGFWSRRRTGEPAPVVGLIWAAAAVAGIAVVASLTIELLVGLVLLGMAGSVSRFTYRVVGMLAAVPGAWLIAFHAGITGGPWTRWVVLSAIVVAAPLVATTDEGWQQPALGPLLWVVVAVGIYVNVPDTDILLLLVGVSAPLGVIGWPLDVGRLGTAGAHTAVGLLIWSAAEGATGRPAALIGAVATLGVLVIWPIAATIASGRVPHPVWMVVIQVAVAAVCGRVAGLRERPMEVALIAAAALVVGLVALVTLGRESPQPDP